jgi:redox-sensitive bicupin YhaK (pirin superfamily)
VARVITLRRADDRGLVELDWLSSRHSFSFGEYHDRAHMGFRQLRVINEDHVKPGRGFDTHGHRDMEILTWVLSGELEHKDSMGNGSVIRPGELQRMSAGTGVQHSEHNPDDSRPVHLLQIWIRPDRRGHAPGYDQRHFPQSGRADRLQLIASPDGADGSLVLNQDARVHALRLAAGSSVRHAPADGRGLWLQLTHGALTLEAGAEDAPGGEPGELEQLAAGDGASVEGAASVTLTAVTDAQALLFDLA